LRSVSSSGSRVSADATGGRRLLDAFGLEVDDVGAQRRRFDGLDPQIGVAGELLGQLVGLDVDGSRPNVSTRPSTLTRRVAAAVSRTSPVTRIL
jgi:hypothetical protein